MLYPQSADQGSQFLLDYTYTCPRFEKRELRISSDPEGTVLFNDPRTQVHSVYRLVQTVVETSTLSERIQLDYRLTMRVLDPGSVRGRIESLDELKDRGVMKEPVIISHHQRSSRRLQKESG